MTTGILLRRMSSNPSLSNVTHVIIDEVHERTAHVDFLMALLRDLIRSRSAVIPDLDSSRKEAAVVSASPRAPPPRLKLILMSATLDGEKLSRYFDGCPILSAQGRTFPIRQVFLEQAYEEMAPDYVLAQDSEAALRRPWRHRHHQLKGKHAESCRETSASHQKASNSGHIIAQAADEGDDDFPLSPYYDPNHYPHDAFSARTRLNLSRLDEGKIDYELIEHLITHVDEKVLGVKVRLHSSF